MKISKSKQELARIISENGGWRNGEFAAQDGDGSVGGYDVKPEWNSLAKYWWREAWGEWFLENKIKNHHQTVLSRAEYFHLYPAPDADGWIEHDGKHEPEISTSGLTIWCKWSDGLEQSHEANMVDWIDDSDVRVVAYRLHKHEKSPGWLCGEAKLAELVAAREALGAVLIAAGVEPESDVAKADAEAKPQFCESVMRSIPEPTDKPTIEQLAADCRNAKEYAGRKQQEADDAKADADEKLKALEFAGEALGLKVSPIAENMASQKPPFRGGDW